MYLSETNAGCIIAYNIYGSCRRQQCLTSKELSPAHAACNVCGTGRGKSDIINPPDNTEFAVVDGLKIRDIKILHKQPNPRREGFWDIRIKYVFEYLLTFFDDAGSEISRVEAVNTFISKETLFGKRGDNGVIGTDLFKNPENILIKQLPRVLVKGAAVALDVKILNDECRSEVHVDIGLFSDISLLRLEEINVLTNDATAPDECEYTAFDPCDYFLSMPIYD
ncbi:MAG: hypothetical protein FWF79_02995 [Defluviitaleaceae bacterium]|nr:hypothetical protein [Defluviitaleaceae bacterium]